MPKTDQALAPGAKRITKAQLARLIPTTATLVDYHMRKEGAPVRGADKTWPMPEAEVWMRDHMAWAAGAGGGESRKLKDRLLVLEVEEKEAAAGLRRGELVSMKDISDSMSALWVDHEAMLRQKFEHELPPKYQGKNETERRQLNVKALQEIGEAFRSGKQRVETAAATP